MLGENTVKKNMSSDS